LITQVLYILDSLLVLQGLGALAEGIGFLKFVSKSTAKPLSSSRNLPSVSIIAPCKGRDSGFEENIAALFRQGYPDFEILFAIAEGNDPAREVIETVMAQHQGVHSKLIVAGSSSGRSEKINNLLAALDEVNERHPTGEERVFVFFDSDARPRTDWLRSLVEPLMNPEVGAATGYRWYLPDLDGGRDKALHRSSGGFWSALLSAWNGTVATTLGDHVRNFAWGGSTAIAKHTFDRIGVAERWKTSASDDYALTAAVQQAGLKIRFVPRCLLVTREQASFRSLIEFTTRQVIITRVYRPRAWWVGLVSYALFNLGFWSSLGRIGAAIASRWAVAFARLLALGLQGAGPPTSMWIVTVLTALIYVLGCAKGLTRLFGVLRALPEFTSEIKRLWWAYCLAWPVVSLVFLYNFLRSATTRRIMWRGVRYELRSPSETIIL
jgi:ceramide glucosyltransferase